MHETVRKNITNRADHLSKRVSKVHILDISKEETYVKP